jgi:hypothetical protein
VKSIAIAMRNHKQAIRYWHHTRCAFVQMHLVAMKTNEPAPIRQSSGRVVDGLTGQMTGTEGSVDYWVATAGLAAVKSLSQIKSSLPHMG